MDELTILTRQAPGIAEFDNYEEIRAYLAARLEGYKHLVYSEDSLKLAKADKKTLTRLKKALDERRKEIKKIYSRSLDTEEERWYHKVFKRLLRS